MTYRVKDWDQNFENAKSRHCKTMTWVPIPTRHDGAGFRIVAGHERAPELFAAWVLIVQVAAKMPVRGVLSKDSRALTAKDLSLRTGFPQGIFDLAFSELAKAEIGWLEVVE